MRVPNNSMSTAVQRMQQTPICIMKQASTVSHRYIKSRAATLNSNLMPKHSTVSVCMVSGSLGVQTTGQHLWGLTNGVPLRSKKRSPRIFDCVWPRNAPRHFMGPRNGVPPYLNHCI